MGRRNLFLRHLWRIVRQKTVSEGGEKILTEGVGPLPEGFVLACRDYVYGFEEFKRDVRVAGSGGNSKH